jgi:hypothetical protein
LVLILVLSTQSLALTVVRLALPSASELDLIPREVGVAFSLLYKDLNESEKKGRTAVSSVSTPFT